MTEEQNKGGRRHGGWRRTDAEEQYTAAVGESADDETAEE